MMTKSSNAIMKKSFFYLSIASILFSCKDYEVDDNVYRDPDLVGTWVQTGEVYNDNPTLEVFTETGHYGNTIFDSSAKKHQAINGTWYASRAISASADYGRVHMRKRIRNGILRSIKEYSVKNDTLLLKSVEYENVDTLVKYKYQLKFDGADCTGLDSIN